MKIPDIRKFVAAIEGLVETWKKERELLEKVSTLKKKLFAFFSDLLAGYEGREITIESEHCRAFLSPKDFWAKVGKPFREVMKEAGIELSMPSPYHPPAYQDAVTLIAFLLDLDEITDCIKKIVRAEEESLHKLAEILEELKDAVSPFLVLEELAT